MLKLRHAKAHDNPVDFPAIKFGYLCRGSVLISDFVAHRLWISLVSTQREALQKSGSVTVSHPNDIAPIGLGHVTA